MKSKITPKQMREIVAEYSSQFPSWTVVGFDALVRFNGAVAQLIWFDRLRTGTYRPTCRVHVLVAPSESGGTVVLTQFLNIKHREISLQNHQKMINSVTTSIKSEIIPAVSRPIDASNIAELLSDRPIVRPVNAYALAFLCASLGRNDDAKRWIAEYQKAFRDLGLPEQPSDTSRVELLKQLSKWIDYSDLKDQLAAIVTQESAKLMAS